MNPLTSDHHREAHGPQQPGHGPVHPKPPKWALGSLLVALLLLTTGASLPLDERGRLKVRTKRAHNRARLTGAERAYAKAKTALRRGAPTQALAALKNARPRMLEDRIALLRGDALLALGHHKRAKTAYKDALEHAQTRKIARRAARSLINVLTRTRDMEAKLKLTEALLKEKNVARRPNLLFQKATTLDRLGRETKATHVAWKALLNHPGARVSQALERFVQKKKKKGIKVPITTTKLELLRIKNLIRSSAYTRATKRLDKLKKTSPKAKTAIDFLYARMYRRRGWRQKEEEILLRLHKRPLKKRGDEVLFRLGKLAMSRDDDTRATAWFHEAARRFPESKHAEEGQYFAAWLPYNRGQYMTASRRMLGYAERYPTSKKRTDALWYAGWAAYLAKKEGMARRAFGQLLVDHPKSTLGPQARYWLGRLRERQAQIDAAKGEYREVLRMSPLSYYGFWASARLESLGEKVVLKAPPPQKALKTEQIITGLGPKRPIIVDRAIALHDVGLKEEALEDLRAADRFFRRLQSPAGRTRVADLLHNLGAHHQAFRVALSVAASGADLVSGRASAWRAFRHAYPFAFKKAVLAASKSHGVEPVLVWSIMRTESHFRPHVRSPAGARGLMQLMPKTAKSIGRMATGGRRYAYRYKRPEANVWLGTWYLGSLLDKYEGQRAPAIAAYNAGPTAVRQWLNDFGGWPLDEFVERIPYRETRRYVRRVFETLMIYRLLAGESLPKLLVPVSAPSKTKGTINF